MSQKYIKTKNKNSKLASFGKYFAQAVYDNRFVETEQLADFFEMGQKVKLDGIGIFKVGCSAIGVEKVEDCTSATITTRRVLFQPETTRVVVGQEKKSDGSVKQKYVNAITLLKDVVFEETHDNNMNTETGGSSSSSGGGPSMEG